MVSFGLISPFTLGFIIMCLHPVEMWDTGRVSPLTGKRVLTAKWSPLFRNTPSVPVPCGKCIACLESRRNQWCIRMLLESTQHQSASFVTLTYDDKHLPPDRLCSKRDIQLFLKRLRFAHRDYGVLPFPDFKYFVVCEYGKRTHRAHYHAIFFGIDCLESRWKPRLIGCDRYPRVSSDVLAAIWSKGFVLVDRVTPSTVRYVSKYITKQNEGCWSLKSIGLAKSLFVTEFGMTQFGLDSVRSGYVAVPSRSGFTKVRVPKFVDRYIEKFEPDLYSSLKASRLEYALNSLAELPTAVRERLEHQSAVENSKRILDNEETTLLTS